MVATAVGREGFVGVTLAQGVALSPHRVICQVHGEALRLPAGRFRRALASCPELDRLVRRYTAYLMREAAQTIACNATHQVEARAARWLLMIRDRVGADEFPLTHELLAFMLGVRRQTVTVLLGTLEAAGILRARRGFVVVADRDRLESAACECYGSARAYYERIVR